jgi:dipeptidyl aminopeptidase/acylaminoacyl peptidase
MRREDVEFSSDGTTVRGWLYRPDVDASTEKVPAVALAGGWC